MGLSQARLAEITGVQQASLSSFELGKTTLRSDQARRVLEVFAGGQAIKLVAGRKKRYRRHEFAKPRTDSDRRRLAHRTCGNAEYVELLKSLHSARTSIFPSRPTAVSLFSGCGGLSTGFGWGGFKVVGFVEIQPAYREIYARNFPDSEELGTDITRETDTQIGGWRERLGSVDVIIGGPPCQGFSLAGKRRIDDSRNTLFEHYLRVVEKLRPKVAVLENVRLLTSMRSPDGGMVSRAIYHGFAAKGYDVRQFEVNAKSYGVPQHRERVIFVATRADQRTTPTIPEPTHGLENDMFSRQAPYRTFADACSDLPFLESGEKSPTDILHASVHHPAHVIDWLWDVPQGASAHDNAEESMRPPSGYNTTYKRQVWLEPAATVQTTFGMISGCRNVHPIATRSLTIREAARIQSFPDTFEFFGTQGAIRQAIGNAVPPLFAYCLARHIKDQLLKHAP
jgi:DNA (cytosine-5)-methyltransferase 1